MPECDEVKRQVKPRPFVKPRLRLKPKQTSKEKGILGRFCRSNTFNGHTTDVQMCSAMKRLMSCATAEIILILCANDAHFTPSRSPMTRPTTTSVTVLRLPCHQTSMMMDVLRTALTSNPTNLTVC